MVSVRMGGWEIDAILLFSGGEFLPCDATFSVCIPDSLQETCLDMMGAPYCLGLKRFPRGPQIPGVFSGKSSGTRWHPIGPVCVLALVPHSGSLTTLVNWGRRGAFHHAYGRLCDSPDFPLFHHSGARTTSWVVSVIDACPGFMDSHTAAGATVTRRAQSVKCVTCTRAGASAR